MIVLTKSTTPVQFNISSSTGFNHTGTTTANAATFVTIPSNLQVRESNYTYRHLGLHVTSSPSQPISVVLVGYTSTPRSTYLALPCHDQPTDEYIYYGMSNDGGQNTNPYTFYSQILLVGCRDNTTVTITPTQTIQLPQDPQESNSAIVTIIEGTSYTVTLHSLQTLLIAVQYEDLSGTKIVSNYPLTVVGGHDCTLVPQPYGDCDPIATQAPPTLNWGTQFLLTPLQNRTNGQSFKLIASENDTNVNITCHQSLNINSVSAGQVIIFDVSASLFCYVHCSHPCYIAELAFGRHYPFFDASYGDPLLMTVPPIRQYPHSVTFTTLPEMPTNFYSIAVPADAYFNGTVIINGVLTISNWFLILDSNGVISGYGYTTAANGSYTISHSHPNGKIYVSVYGFMLFGGYGYPAGMLLNSLANATFIDSSSYLSLSQYTSTVITTTTVFTTGYMLTPTETIDSSSTACTEFIITTNILTTTVTANNVGSIISCDYSTMFVPMPTIKTTSFDIVPTNVICPSNGDVISVTVTETTPVITNCMCDTGSLANYFTTPSTGSIAHTVITTSTINNLMSSSDYATVFATTTENTKISPITYATTHSTTEQSETMTLPTITSIQTMGVISSCDFSTVFISTSIITTSSFHIVPTTTICPTNGDVISVTITETTSAITNCICNTGSLVNYFTTDTTAVDFTHAVTTTLTNSDTVIKTSSCDQTTVFVPIVTSIDCLEKTDISPTTTISSIESQMPTTSNTITAISVQTMDVSSSYDTHSTNEASTSLTTITSSYPDDNTPSRTDDISMDSSKPTTDHILTTTLVITASCTSTNFDTTTSSDKAVRPSNNVIGTSSKVTDTTSALGGSMALIIIIIIVICIIVAIVSYKVGMKRGKSQVNFQNTDVSMVQMSHSNVMALHNVVSEHNDSEYEDMAPPEQIVQFTEPNISSLMIESLNTQSLPAYENIDSLYEPMASPEQVQFTETEMLSSMEDNSGDHTAPTYHGSTSINTNDSNFTPYFTLSTQTIKEPSVYDTISHPLPPLPSSEIIGATFSPPIDL